MEKKSHDRWATFCFFSMAFWLGAPTFTIACMVTEDILSGSKWSSTIVLVAFSIPDIVFKVVSPPIVRRISDLCSMVVLIALLCGSLLIIVLMDNVELRLLGVAVLGCAYGFGSVACYSMLSYHKDAIAVGSAVQFGLNTACLVGSFVYGGKYVVILKKIVHLKLKDFISSMKFHE